MSRLIVALATALLLAPATASAQRASLPDIEDEVMCPVCGTLLELSEAPQAERQREMIRRLIQQGRDKEEIKETLVAEYGPEVLAVPEDEGFDLTAWLVPGAGLLIALGLVALAVLRSSRLGHGEPAPRRLDPGDSQRLERDLSRYEG